MDREKFKEFLKGINSYFGLDNKYVTKKQFNQWYEQIKNIPYDIEIIDYIKERIFNERDSLPKNMPKYMKTYFREYFSANPSKLNIQEKTPCEECGGHGLIHYADDRGQYRIWRMARCPYCENWKRHIGINAMKLLPIRTVQDLQENGHTVMKRKLAR